MSIFKISQKELEVHLKILSQTILSFPKFLSMGLRISEDLTAAGDGRALFVRASS